MKSRLPMPITTFRQIPKPKKPMVRCAPADRAVQKPSQPSYEVQRESGKTRVIDFPADPFLFDASLAQPYSKDVVHVVKAWIVDSFCVQLTLFIIKLLCLAVTIGTIALIYLEASGDDVLIVSIIGAAAAAIGIVMSVFVFYYLGVVNARRQLQLQRGFVVFMALNYALSLVSLAGFGYFGLHEIMNDDLKYESDLKTWIDLAFATAAIVYFLLGATISVLVMGILLHITRLLHYVLILLYKALTMKLFANVAQLKTRKTTTTAKVTPLPSSSSPLRGSVQSSHPECECDDAGTKADDLVGTHNPMLVSSQREPFADSKSVREDDPLPQPSAEAKESIRTTAVKTGLVLRPLKGVVKPYRTSMKIKSCGICQRGFVLDEKVVGLTCNQEHMFHLVCLKERQNGGSDRKGECPTCSRCYFI